MKQRKLDGQQSIHYTATNNLRGIRTTDGQNMVPAMTFLIIEMVGSERKHITLKLF